VRACEAGDTRNGILLTERTDSARGRWFSLEFWVCGTFEVRDGKIALWRDYFDLGAITLKTFASPRSSVVSDRTAADEGTWSYTHVTADPFGSACSHRRPTKLPLPGAFPGLHILNARSARQPLVEG
jgi:hypothetical protein